MSDTINVEENVIIPNQFSFNNIYNLILQNKTYLLIGIVILAALGYYIYITYFMKNSETKNKIKDKLQEGIYSDNSEEEVVIKKQKIQTPIKPSKVVKTDKVVKKKVIIQETESSDSEPEHLTNLDLTQSELNNINNSLDK